MSQRPGPLAGHGNWGAVTLSRGSVGNLNISDKTCLINSQTTGHSPREDLARRGPVGRRHRLCHMLDPLSVVSSRESLQHPSAPPIPSPARASRSPPGPAQPLPPSPSSPRMKMSPGVKGGKLSVPAGRSVGMKPSTAREPGPAPRARAAPSQHPSPWA